MKQDEDNTDFLIDILLNKNIDLRWYYFDIDLGSIFNRQGIEPTISTLDDFLNDTPGNVDAKNIYGPNKDSLILKEILIAFNKDKAIFSKVAKKIFDMNEIPNRSDADQGLIGIFNEKDRAFRNNLFFKRIKEGQRPSTKVILAEGDSWFQFPRIFLNIDAVADIIDQLIDGNKNYAIYSLAYGGDWLSNILSLGEYVEELPRLGPDAFLISGGGNDMVGGMRLATMVENPFLPDSSAPSSKEIDLHIKNDKCKARLLNIRIEQASNGYRTSFFSESKYRSGIVFIQDEYFQFLNLIFVQYFIFMFNITQSGKYPKMKIITQGYDFSVPKRKGNPHPWPYRWINELINKFNDNGDWLNTPLRLKGIPDGEMQEAAVYVMIYEFNEMLIQLANFKIFENVFHIDCRGIASYDDGDWFDELHLMSHAFKRVTKLYEACIENGGKNSDPKCVYNKSDL